MSDGTGRATQGRSKRHYLKTLMMSTALSLGALPVILPTVQAQAQSAATHSFNIPSQPLARALRSLADQSGIQLAYKTSVTSGATAPAVRGTMTTQQALSRLLSGSNLQYSFTNANTVAIVNAAPSGGAGAATVAGAIQLDTIDVQGGSPYPSDPYAGTINPPTTVGSKTPTPWKELPQTADVITQQQIKQQNVQSLDQALKYTPGVTVYQSDPSRFQYYSRGFPISSMQIDGVPVVMNSNMSGTAGTNAPNLAAFDRVEVLDGPSGLYNGLGTVGGTINLVRKRAPNQFMASTDLTIGNYNNLLGTVDIGGPLNAAGTVRGRFVASGQSLDLQQDTRWRRDQSFYATIEADITPNTLLRFGASYMDRNSNVGWGNGNKAYTGTSIIAGSPSQFFGAPWNENRSSTTDVFASLEHKLDNGWKVTASADYTHNTYRLVEADFCSTVDPQTNIARICTNNLDYKEDNQAYDINATGPYSLFGREHELTFGVNYTRMHLNHTAYYGPDGNDFFATPVDYFNINFPKPTWNGLPSDTDKNDEFTNQVGLYGNTRFHITDALTAVAGARISWWTDEFTPDAVYNYDQFPHTKDTYAAKVTPFGGVIYDFNKTYSAYASYSTVFQPQTVYSRGGTILPPMQGDQYEVGLKGSYLDGRLNASVALFQITQENRAVPDPTDFTNTYYISQGKARTRGVDVRVSGEIQPGWTIFAGYTYNISKYLDKDSIDTVASNFTQIAPTHLFKLWTNYKLPGQFDHWEIGGGVNATSKLYSGNGATRLTQPAFFTADARIAYNFNQKVSLALNATNIFNKVYYQPGNGKVVYGDPRRVMLTLHGQW